MQEPYDYIGRSRFLCQKLNWIISTQHNMSRNMKIEAAEFLFILICAGKSSHIFDRPPTKLREGNVFSFVCLSTKGWGGHDALDLVLTTQPLPPYTQLSLTPLHYGHGNSLYSTPYWYWHLVANEGGAHPFEMRFCSSLLHYFLKYCNSSSDSSEKN